MVSLSSLLRFSQSSLERIQNIIEGSPAYIVGGYPSFNDIILANLLNVPFLSGNPSNNMKFCSNFYTRRFLHVNNFPYMVFSYKFKREADIEKNFARLVIDSPYYSSWKFEIDREVMGRGHALFNLDFLSIATEIRAVEDPVKREEYLKPLISMLKKTIENTTVMSCPKVYSNYGQFKDVMLAKGGFVTAVAKGSGKSIAVTVFISPSGDFQYLTSYEQVLTEKGFLGGYIWPQRDIPVKALQSLSKKIGEKMFEQGVYGYITIVLSVQVGVNRNYKVCVDSVIPYYDEFLAHYETIKLMASVDEEQKLAAVIIPRIEDLDFSKEINYFQFFQRSRQKGILYDMKEKTGVIFSMTDSLNEGIMGFIAIGK